MITKDKHEFIYKNCWAQFSRSFYISIKESSKVYHAISMSVEKIPMPYEGGNSKHKLFLNMYNLIDVFNLYFKIIKESITIFQENEMSNNS